MKVKWKDGYTPAAVSAQTAYDTVQELYEQGKSSAKDLVDASRPEYAPLHGLFEWDDSVAAEKYRESQARLIIRSLVIVPEDDEQQPVVRAFSKVEPVSNGLYEPTFVIMKDEGKREMLLNRAKDELKAFAVKYGNLTELAGVIDAISDFINR